MSREELRAYNRRLHGLDTEPEAVGGRSVARGAAALFALVGLTCLPLGIFVGAGAGIRWMEPIARAFRWLAVNPLTLIAYLLLAAGACLIAAALKDVRR